jgi:choline transport protein
MSIWLIITVDEAKDAPKVIPWSMFLSVSINFGFAFIICLLYCLENYEVVSTSPTGLPIIKAYYEATKSKEATNVLIALIFIMYTIGNLNVATFA